LKPPNKSEKWRRLEKKLSNFERLEDTIQRFNHEPFNLAISYDEFEVKPEKILERESLAPTGKVLSGLHPTLTTEHTDYKSWMEKQSHECEMPPT